MEIKEKVIKAYKGFNSELKCRDYQYEVGKEYTLSEGENVNVCENGFHACESPLEVFDYYFLLDGAKMARFCEVEQFGRLDRKEKTTKVASSKIKIKSELKFADLIKLGIEWIKDKTNQDSYLSDNGEREKKIASSGSRAQIGSSGDNVKIASSGSIAQIGSSGYSAQIGSIGDYAQIASSGSRAQIGSSGDNVKIASSGSSAKIASSGYSAQIGSSGDSAQIASSGSRAKIGSSGDYVKIASSGYSAQIGSIGDSAQIASSGSIAKIGSSGDNVKMASSGSSAKIGSSGYSAHIDSTGEDSVICCAGHNSMAKAKIGSWITLAEWEYSKEKERYVPKCVKTEYVDGERIKADTWYKLVDGEFKEQF